MRFDLTKMSWIGKAATDPRVITIGTQSPIMSYKDLLAVKEPVNFSTGGIGASAYVETVMLVNAEAAGEDTDRLLRLGRRSHRHPARGDRRHAGLAVELGGAVVANGQGRFIAQIGGEQQRMSAAQGHGHR